MKRSYDVLKRTVDLSGAGATLVLLSPVLAAVAVAVRLTMGSPVLFRQERPGLGGKPFTMYKIPHDVQCA